MSLHDSTDATLLSQSLRHNKLLAALPSPVLARLTELADVRLCDAGEKVRLDRGDELLVAFPLTAVLALRRDAAPDGAVPVATVGCEGAAGLCRALDPAISVDDDVIVVIPGDVARFAARALHEEADPAFSTIGQHYVLALLEQLAQDAACRRLHDAEQRIPSMLLRLARQCNSDELRMTQAELADLLGLRRAVVNAVATALQRQGLIRYSRGRIQILDRQALAREACSCFLETRDTPDVAEAVNS